jgi:hypothetical protein
MMVLLVPSETSHWKGNESQDTITLLEIVSMSIKRGMQLQEAKGFMKSTR